MTVNFSMDFQDIYTYILTRIGSILFPTSEPLIFLQNREL